MFSAFTCTAESLRSALMSLTPLHLYPSTDIAWFRIGTDHRSVDICYHFGFGHPWSGHVIMPIGDPQLTCQCDSVVPVYVPFDRMSLLRRLPLYGTISVHCSTTVDRAQKPVDDKADSHIHIHRDIFTGTGKPAYSDVVMSFHGLSPEPNVAPVESTMVIDGQGDDWDININIASLIAAAIGYVSKDKSRPTLNGMLIMSNKGEGNGENNDSTLVSVASDGFRLIEHVVAIPYRQPLVVPCTFGVVVPRDICRFVTKYHPDLVASMSITNDAEHYVVFRWNNGTEICCNQAISKADAFDIREQFPAYQAIIKQLKDKKQTATATVSAPLLHQALIPVVTEHGNVLHLTVNKESIDMIATNTGNSSTFRSELCAVATLPGTKHRFAINPVMLDEALAKASEITIHVYGGAADPVLITYTDRPGTQVLIMPMFATDDYDDVLKSHFAGARLAGSVAEGTRYGEPVKGADK
jgi:DNA polymerase III sliding clamp (beta) subunit (PCNA family)